MEKTATAKTVAVILSSINRVGDRSDGSRPMEKTATAKTVAVILSSINRVGARNGV